MMKYAIVFLFAVSILNAQNSTNQEINAVQIGDVFEIGRPESNSYNHINFPSENFIIKRGGIANYKLAEGEKVVVTSVKEKKNGITKVKIKRKDGGRFFGSHSVVSADFKEALESGELQSL